MVRELDDLAVLEIGIIENVQRADLNVLEEALSYKVLMEKFERTQEAIAKTIGKSRSHVANTMRLLALPDEVQSYLVSGELSAGHARAIAAAADPVALAKQIIDGRSVGARDRGPGPQDAVRGAEQEQGRPSAAREGHRHPGARGRPVVGARPRRLDRPSRRDGYADHHLCDARAARRSLQPTDARGVISI
jgi:ParB family chromosome partitioning protein